MHTLRFECENKKDARLLVTLKAARPPHSEKQVSETLHDLTGNLQGTKSMIKHIA